MSFLDCGAWRANTRNSSRVGLHAAWPFGLLMAFVMALSYIGETRASETSLTEAQAFIEDLLTAGKQELANDGLSSADRHNWTHDLAGRAFDIPAIARYTLGKHRRSLSKPELSDFEELYHDYVVASYMGKISALADRPISVEGAKTYGKTGDALVSTKLMTADGKAIDIGWRVRRREEGLKILDIVVKGISLLVTQRAEFKALIEHRGVDGLKQAMRDQIGRATPSGGRKSGEQSGDGTQVETTKPIEAEGEPSNPGAEAG